MTNQQEKITSYVCELDNTQIEQFKTILEAKGWEFSQQQYAHWKARLEKTNIIAYNSGKVTVQGKGTSDIVLFALEPEILKKATLGYEFSVEQESGEDIDFSPHAGIDESGKGDFFGPLVIAAAYVDEEANAQLIKAGVKDSKAIKSDDKIAEIARRIRAILKDAYAIVTIGPEAYNRLYQNFDNLNKLLAWGHARSLENLLEKVPACREAIADKFGNEKLIKQALMKNGKTVNLTQMTKAERDIAVAAASILARDQFVQRMKQQSEAYAVAFHKGASAKVIEDGVSFCRQHGRNMLPLVGKMHFRTVENIDRELI